jgi:two-component system, response regulator YesN
MYNILVVDDEPLICKGLSHMLGSSGMDIGHIFIAYNGYEALDYIRAEEIDLLITDIQMGEMSGIELMNQAKIVKPWMETIVISAHETFQHAQMAIRLGAKDYMIKPLKNDQFLDSVRNVLLSYARPASSQNDVLSSMREHFQMADLDPGKNKALNELLTTAGSKLAKDVSTLTEKYGIMLHGPYFAVIRIQLLLPEVSLKDKALFQYAALNIVSELLDQNWNHFAFCSGDSQICILLQWSEQQYADPAVNKIDQLEMIGRGLNFNIEKYLRVQNVAGLSQILRGAEFFPELGEQAQKALQWNRNHADHFIFYYGDVKWSLHGDDSSEEEWVAQSNLIVKKAKEYVDGHYAEKGITANKVAHKCHVSPNYLSYLFKKYMGCKLWEYVVKLRMEESRRLLLSSGLRSYEVADRVGYESSEHFSKSFKRYFGISPRELKN